MKKNARRVGNTRRPVVVPAMRRRVSLAECPPGLFLFDGDYGYKTEYSDDNGPEAYCLESGEYFWGGTNGDKAKRRALLVMPCELRHNDQAHSCRVSEAKEAYHYSAAYCRRYQLRRCSRRMQCLRAGRGVVSV